MWRTSKITAVMQVNHTWLITLSDSWAAPLKIVTGCDNFTCSCNRSNVSDETQEENSFINEDNSSNIWDSQSWLRCYMSPYNFINISCHLCVWCGVVFCDFDSADSYKPSLDRQGALWRHLKFPSVFISILSSVGIWLLKMVVFYPKHPPPCPHRDVGHLRWGSHWTAGPWPPPTVATTYISDAWLRRFSFDTRIFQVKSWEFYRLMSW